MNDVQKGIMLIVAIIGMLMFMAGMFYAAKHISYFLLYEGMVQETVNEMVDSKYLNKPGSSE